MAWQLCARPCPHGSRALWKEIFGGKRSRRGGLRHEQLTGPHWGQRWPLLKGRRGAEPRRAFGGSAALRAAGSRGGGVHSDSACLPSVARRKGHNGPFQPRLWERKVRELLLCASPAFPGGTRRGHALGSRGEVGRLLSLPSHRIPKPRLLTRPFARLFPCESRTWLRGLRCRERWPRGREPAQSIFPIRRQGIFFCVEQRLAHSSAKQLPHRCAEPAATAATGAGAMLGQSQHALGHGQLLGEKIEPGMVSRVFKRLC